jgi:eukaryotic-like serine/threonine-protein kinase
MSNIIGKTLLNQFRVDSFVASGGMGAVYRVWDTKRNVPLAMKVLHPELADDPVMFKRFQREARALQQLSHPNIVPFYGLYQDGDTLFILQKFVDGPSLKEVLRQRHEAGIPAKEVLSYLQAICSALGFAHAKGLIHCDIKPGNIMVDGSGTVYLADFGIVRYAEGTTTTLAAAGTPAYMAPEQILGRAITPATDVYALGALAFELLTGRRPFTGEEITSRKEISTHEKLRLAHLQVPPPDPRQFNPKIPANIARVILQALAKNPAARYPNAAEFWNALWANMNVAIPAQVSVPQQRAIPIQPTPMPTWAGVGTLAESQPAAMTRPPKQAQGLVIAILAGIFIFGGCFLLLIEPPPPTPPPIYTATQTDLANQTLPPEDVSTSTAFPISTATLEPATETPSPTQTITPSATEPPTFTPAPSETPIPPRPASEWLSFHARRSGSWDILLLNVISGNAQEMIFERFHEKVANWSADGRYVLYERANSGGLYYSIYLFDTQTRSTTRITHGEDCSSWSPDFSPDNSQVVFYTNCDGASSSREVYVMNLDGEDLRRISSTGGLNRYPAWSPDGHWIVYTSSTQTINRLYRVSPNGGEPVFIANGCSATFSPDGEWLYYSSACQSDGQIRRARLDGSQITDIGTVPGRNPALSPDGSLIAFQVETSAIWVMNADGTDAREVIRGTEVGVPMWRPFP